MKKNVLFCAIMAFVLVSCSNNGEKAERDYALRFAKVVNSGDSAQIVKMYPDAAMADSLALSFEEDSLKIERNEKGDSIRILYTPEIWVDVVKDATDSLRIVCSKGLFAYPAEQLTFAKNTGQYADNLDDKSNAERMADKAFHVYMVKKVKEKIKNSLKIVSTNGCDYYQGEGGLCPAGYIATVENQSDVMIEGKTYRVIISDRDWDPDLMRDKITPHPIAGKDLQPGEREPFRFSYGDRVVFSFSAVLQVLDIGDGLFASYKPTGNEYEEYITNR